MNAQAWGLEAPAFKPFRMELSPDGAIHEAMRLYDDEDRNQNVWSRMPPYYWCAAVKRASPAATVLAWNPNVGTRQGMLPLIAYQYSGQGKVMFVGTDSTYLWRQNVGDRFFYKFWGQAIRYVARRGLDKSEQSWIEVRPVRAQPKERTQVELMAFGADGSPRTESKLNVRVTGGNTAKTLELIADDSKKGRYFATFVPEATGDYRFVFDPGNKK